METLKELSGRLGLPFTEELPQPAEAAELVGRLPISFAKKSEMAPVKIKGDRLQVITSRPLDHHALSDLRQIYEMPVDLLVAPPELVTEFINRAYEISTGSAEDILDEVEDEAEKASLQDIAQELEGPTDLLDTDEEAPIVRLLNSLLQQAVKEKASDIHIEAFATSISVRMRIDGILYTVLKLPRRIAPQLASRVKIMAGLDIAEKRLPQDGRISIKAAGREIDLRVSTVPTSFGERVVLRLLDKSRNLLFLDKIGMGTDHMEQMKNMVELSNGIILVTGPTGSGKTTTLYSLLGQVKTEQKNVITVEDPVEYQIRGIGQMQVNPAIGLTFATGLRSILRQDPDMIMVGEIRDLETASIAVQASLTGHLVLSTLHTNDSATTLTRLVDIGVEPFLIASSLVSILAQRLVRVLCQDCRKPVELSGGDIKKMGIGAVQGDLNVYKSGGCGECMNSGYKGRTGIFELLAITDPIRSLLVKGADASSIRQRSIAEGTRLLRLDGIEKVRQGITTLDEVLRVTDDYPSEEIV